MLHRDGGGYCRDGSPNSPKKRRVWETRPTGRINTSTPLIPRQQGTHKNNIKEGHHVQTKSSGQSLFTRP